MLLANPPTHSQAYPKSLCSQHIEIIGNFLVLGAWEVPPEITTCAYKSLTFTGVVKGISSHTPKNIKRCGITGGCFTGLCGKAWECLGGSND